MGVLRENLNVNQENLYQQLKKYVIHEELGYYVNIKKFKTIINRANKINDRIFEKAFKDALFIVNQIRKEMGDIRVIDLKRIDFLNKEQLKILLFSIGAAKNHENVSENATETTSFTNILGINPEDLLVCKVAGDSMLNANIFEGDTLIIDTKSEPKNNEIAVININNQMVFKRIRFQSNKIFLVPENENFEIHEVSESDNFSVLGIVKHIIHSI